MSRPTFSVFVQGRPWSDPYYKGSDFTLGDSASIGASVVAALYIFHVSSAEKMRLLGIFYHVGAILAIQGYPAWSVSQPVDAAHKIKEASKMADICLLWSKSRLFFSPLL